MKRNSFQRAFCILISLILAALLTLPLNASAAPKPLLKDAAVTLNTPKLSIVKNTLKASEVSLQWNKIANATDYELQRKSGTESDYKTILTTNKTKFTDQHLNNSTTYTYRVRAVRQTNTSTKNITGEYSKAVSKTTSKGLSRPSGVTINKINKDQVSISWKARKNTTAYAVYTSINGGAPVYLSKTSKTATSIKLKNTNYSTLNVSVRPINKYGEGAFGVSDTVDLRFKIKGSLVKAYNVYGEQADARVEVRKIGNSVAYIGRVQTSGDILAYTVAGPGESQKTRLTSAQAKSVNALIAVNGDYYSYSTRRDYFKIIRNGKVYRDLRAMRDHYVVFADGSAQVLTKSEVPSAYDLVEAGATQSFVFGPGLIRNGAKMLPYPDSAIHPRTAIGQVSPSEWIFLVVDGRQSGYSVGMTYNQIADIMLEMGCDTAYNFDGGGSSCMYLKGAGVINRPSDGTERSVPDIVYFK